jgi:transcriptional regulator with XRE-family HTH domain
MNLGEKVKCLRKNRGWLQKELGDKIGKSDGAISCIERKTILPKKTIIALAKVFNTTIDFLENDTTVVTLLKSDKCYICGDIGNLKGLCRKHYEKAIRLNIINNHKNEIKNIIDKIEIEKERKKTEKVYCYVCHKERHLTKGLCPGCYTMALTNDWGEFSPTEIKYKINNYKTNKQRIKAENKCLICGNKHSTKGLCKSCYYKARRLGILDKPIKEIAQCFDLLGSNTKRIKDKKKVNLLKDKQPKASCYICGDTSLIRGLCSKHYSYVRRKGLLTNTKEEITHHFKENTKRVALVKCMPKASCYICGDITLSRDLCSKHYSYARRKGLLTKSKEDILYQFNEYGKHREHTNQEHNSVEKLKTNSSLICKEKGCNKPILQKGLCSGCYSKKIRNLKPGDKGYIQCSVDNCIQHACYSKKYCNRHYTQLRLHGNVCENGYDKNKEE